MGKSIHSQAAGSWPVLAEYRRARLGQIAFPLGGIGTGTVSLGGRGNLRDWEVRNKPARGFSPPYSFFALWARPRGGSPITRVLEGAIPPPYDDAIGFRRTTYGLPRFRDCVFKAAYPLAQVCLADPASPLRVRLEAFNPLIPGDADRSGIPFALLRFVLINETADRVDASVCGSLQNFIGETPRPDTPWRRKNRRRRSRRAGGVQGVHLECPGLAPDSPQRGSLCLATTAYGEISHSLAWGNPRGADHLREFWREFSREGIVSEGGENTDHASLAVRVTIPPRAEMAIEFILAWHFPNRLVWHLTGSADDVIGNHYATRYADAWNVAVKAASDLRALEEDTVRFVRTFCESDLPRPIKDAALNNLTALRSETCFRTPDGRLFGWEGCMDSEGCCPGSCTHVWNYEQATPFLFGSLAKGMREVEFQYATNDDGLMSFRVALPLGRKGGGLLNIPAADGQMGCLMKLHREWKLSGDNALLRRLWPKARKALEFCWVPGGWDGDRDGVMEGPQHTTTDFEYFGPNPVGTAWYLGALRAGEEMARRLGETEFAAQLRALFDSGSRWVDRHLFNGEYYEQEIRPRESARDDSPRLIGRMIHDLKDPEYQLGKGCQSDQLMGQLMAHICGLGPILEKRNVAACLRAVMKHNFRKSLGAHEAFFRTFGINDESGLLFGTYPKGEPAMPNFRFSELWTGVEYAVASHMIYEVQTEAGLKVIKAVRGRYDGAKRNPFDEEECGRHYARAMASWGAVVAYTGFQYDAHEAAMRFHGSARKARWFWSNGYAWGWFEQAPLRRGASTALHVLHGSIRLRHLTLQGTGETELPRARTLSRGETIRFNISPQPGRARNGRNQP